MRKAVGFSVSIVNKLGRILLLPSHLDGRRLVEAAQELVNVAYRIVPCGDLQAQKRQRVAKKKRRLLSVTHQQWFMIHDLASFSFLNHSPAVSPTVFASMFSQWTTKKAEGVRNNTTKVCRGTIIPDICIRIPKKC